jgi:hypothetical protein
MKMSVYTLFVYLLYSLYLVLHLHYLPCTDFTIGWFLFRSLSISNSRIFHTWHTLICQFQTPKASSCKGGQFVDLSISFHFFWSLAFHCNGRQFRYWVWNSRVINLIGISTAASSSNRREDFIKYHGKSSGCGDVTDAIATLGRRQPKGRFGESSSDHNFLGVPWAV